MKKIWQRFLYRDSVVLEAERQKAIRGSVEDWGLKFLQLEEDDVFATFIQVYVMFSLILRLSEHTILV